jgi:phosphatidylserine/phosphatidylglycerophosphate/cardiolipin synthase-like enzyme
MRIHKRLYALIGIAIILQACGREAVVSTNAPSATVNVPSITEISVTESITTEGPKAEFFSPIPFRTGLGFHGPWIDLYFIDPTNPFAQREVGGVDVLLAASIIAASQSVDVALKDLDLDSVTNALITANRRGVSVRVVAETDNLTGRSKFQALKDAGIPIVDDQQPGLMNNRFIVIDHGQVWTGSADYDTSGVFRKYDAVIRIFSEEIAADYTKEFDEMFVNNQFGQLVVPETLYPSVDIQGTQVEVLFSPDDLVVSRLTQLLSGAQESIYFLAYAFDSTDLGAIIRDKAAQGVKVSGVLEFDLVDPNRTNPNLDLLEEWNLLRQAGLDVRLDGGPEVMYHKIMIIDGKIVVMGSYDFTNRAENENDENILIIHNEMIAQIFMEEFQRVQSRARQ